jgi:hypothetical protein
LDVRSLGSVLTGLALGGISPSTEGATKDAEAAANVRFSSLRFLPLPLHLHLHRILLQILLPRPLAPTFQFAVCYSLVFTKLCLLFYLFSPLFFCFFIFWILLSKVGHFKIPEFVQTRTIFDWFTLHLSCLALGNTSITSRGRSIGICNPCLLVERW